MKKVILLFVLLLHFSLLRADVIQSYQFIGIKFINLDSFANYDFYLEYNTQYSRKIKNLKINNNDTIFIVRPAYVMLRATNKDDSTQQFRLENKFIISTVGKDQTLKYVFDVFKIKELVMKRIVIEKVQRIYQYEDGKNIIKQDIAPFFDFNPNYKTPNNFIFWLLPLCALLLLIIFFIRRKTFYVR